MDGVRKFTGRGKDGGIIRAVHSCLESGYRPLSMPEIAERRITAPKDDEIWIFPYTSLSLQASGRQKSTNVSRKGGTEVAVFSHDYLANQSSIRKKLENHGNLGMYGYGNMAAGEFQELLAKEDGEMNLVVSRDVLKKWPNGVYGIDEPTEEHMYDFGGKIGGVGMIAINHPVTKAFLTPKKAGPYLQEHKNKFGLRVVGIGNYDNYPAMPACRLLKIGNLISYGHLDFTGSEYVENPLGIHTFAGAKR